MPSAPEAEIAVLGALAMGDDAAPPVAFDRLVPEDFYRAEHRTVFAAALELYRRRVSIDPVTIMEEVVARREMDRNAIGSLLSDCLDAVPTAANIGYHAEIVRDRALRRRMFDAARQIAEDALSGEGKAEEVMDRAERRVLEVAEREATAGPRKAQSVLYSAMELIEKGTRVGVRSGLQNLDRLLGGVKPGTLTIVAGATSMGKSALVQQWLAHATMEQCVPAAIFSIEMTAEENAIRMMANDQMIDLYRLLNQQLEDDDYLRLNTAATRLARAVVTFDDTATRTLEIRSRARRIKAEHGLGLLVVDHIHDMMGEGDSRREQLGKIARELKHLAKELEVPVLAAAQLSREPTRRSSPRPQLSDLHESGDIEQAADVVVLLYRPGYYNTEADPMEAEAIVAKHRNGPKGTAALRFLDYCARFEDARETAAR